MGCGSSTSVAATEPDVRQRTPRESIAKESPRLDGLAPAAGSRGAPRATATAQLLNELTEVSAAEVAPLRKEFEDVSAPMASMTLRNLEKFHARTLRKDTGKVLHHMRAHDPIGSLKKKSIDTEIRDQAKKTAKAVFFWDDETDKPFEDCTVTFEQYLELVLLVRVKSKDSDKGTAVPFERSVQPAGSILRRNGLFSGSHTGELNPESLRESSPGEVSLTPRVFTIKFADDPSPDQLNKEWEAQLQLNEKRDKSHDHADEGAAFKQVKAAIKEKGTEDHIAHLVEDGEAISRAASAASLNSSAGDSAHQNFPARAGTKEVSSTSAQETKPETADDASMQDLPSEGNGKSEAELAETEKAAEDAAPESSTCGDVEAADNGDSTNGMAQSRGMVSKQSGLATEHIFDFWEGEVEYKVKAIWDIRENSHRHKKNLVRQ
jgi:hypothetical protein